MKCPVFLTSEMSALQSGYGNIIHLKKEGLDEDILPRTCTGAGNENPRCDTEDTKWGVSVVSGSRDNRHIMQADAEMEKKI